MRFCTQLRPAPLVLQAPRPPSDHASRRGRLPPERRPPRGARPRAGHHGTLRLQPAQPDWPSHPRRGAQADRRAVEAGHDDGARRMCVQRSLSAPHPAQHTQCTDSLILPLFAHALVFVSLSLHVALLFSPSFPPSPPRQPSLHAVAVYEQYVYDLGEGAQVSAAEFVEDVNEDNVRTVLLHLLLPSSPGRPRRRLALALVLES